MPGWTLGWHLQVHFAAFEQWHVTGVLAVCDQIMELSQDHPVALILSQTFRACLFPLPRFLPPFVLFKRITTLIVKQSLSSLVFKSQPQEPVVGVVDYQCRNIRRKTLVQDIHGPFLDMCLP